MGDRGSRFWVRVSTRAATGSSPGLDTRGIEDPGSNPRWDTRSIRGPRVRFPPVAEFSLCQEKRRQPWALSTGSAVLSFALQFSQSSIPVKPAAVALPEELDPGERVVVAVL
ncbi:hypothetical protein WISP_58802 [Willisornis vidua]|uniref:Uncharacterized protein n=1 Tax=Willisornis vidua TaxID=1566151 RepID=A0ABQ9DHD7_9PASS|nr:hypothetical protein WISP_58802 [Willisornis vidua]